MRILVTGGCGYIGCHTVRELTDAGHAVVVYDNLSTGRAGAVADCKVVVADLADAGLLRRTFSENHIETVIHFAASCYVGESVEDPQTYYLNNVANGLTLLRAMLECEVKNIVFSSSCAVYGIPHSIPIGETQPTCPINPYGRTKLFFENILQDYHRAYGMRYVSLRYFNASGAHPDGQIGEHHDPETHLIPIALQTALAQREHIEIFGTDYDTQDGTCVRDYIHVTDLAQAHILAAECAASGQSGIYNLGNGQGYSVRDVIETARKATKSEIPIIESSRRPGDPPALVADYRKAVEELNWRPRFTSLEDIIESAWRWHAGHPRGYEKADCRLPNAD